ncbi:plastid lipid-associated protein/fibrillin conserved domain-containing protein [Pseudoscourfieldia marina]
MLRPLSASSAAASLPSRLSASSARNGKVTGAGGWQVASSSASSSSRRRRRFRTLPPPPPPLRPFPLLGFSYRVRDFHCAASSSEGNETSASGTHSHVVDLLAICARTARGDAASQDDAARVRDIIKDLKDASENQPTAELVSGKWALAWCDPGVEPFRSSPFFWAFKAAAAGFEFPLVGGGISDVFEFTGSIPSVYVGEATQELALDETGTGRLVSEVSLQVMRRNRAWPVELKGAMRTESVVTQARENEGTLVVDLHVESTRIADTNGEALASTLANITFPSGDALGASADVAMTVEYVDESVRATRVGSMVFVHVRV